MFRHKILNLTGGGRRARSADFHWFDVTNYQAASKFELSDWLDALNLRYQALVRLADGTFMMSNELVSQLLSDPIQFQALHRTQVHIVRHWTDRGEELISDLTMIDAFASLEIEDAEKVLLDLNSFHEFQTSDRRPSRIPWEMPSGFSSRTIRSLLATGGNELPVWVDLNADDEHLMAHFAEWLLRVRKEFGPVSRPQSWSERSRQSWIDFKVLPFIDLNIFCFRVADIALTQAVAGSLLFPDEADVDLTERVRKVVIPLTERLLSDTFIAALDRRVRSPEGKAPAGDSGTPGD
jgi:hypothetical protein